MSTALSLLKQLEHKNEAAESLCTHRPRCRQAGSGFECPHAFFEPASPQGGCIVFCQAAGRPADAVRMCPHGCFGLPPAGNFDSLREKVAAAKHRLQWANRWGLTAGERVTHYTAVIQNLDLMLGDGTRSADELDDLKESVLWFRKVLAVWLDDLRDVATARAQARSVIRAYMRERRV